MVYCALSVCVGAVSQQFMEEDLNCYQSSSTCSGDVTSLPYSSCCVMGSESFMIDEECYACAGMYVMSSLCLFSPPSSHPLPLPSFPLMVNVPSQKTLHVCREMQACIHFMHDGLQYYSRKVVIVAPLIPNVK